MSRLLCVGCGWLIITGKRPLKKCPLCKTGGLIPQPTRLVDLRHAEDDDVNEQAEALVCSWCGDDFEYGDWSSTGCCSCDPMPESGLPDALKEARKEAEEAVHDAGEAEARVAELRQLAEAAIEAKWSARAECQKAEERVAEASRLLELCWQTIAFAPQPDGAKAVAENRLLERVEEWLRAGRVYDTAGTA